LLFVAGGASYAPDDNDIKSGMLLELLLLLMLMLLVFFLTLFALNIAQTPLSIGDRLVRTYTVYVPLPITVTDAKAAGWQTNGVCDNATGIAYNFNGIGPSVSYPLTLYFTSGGQVAGAGVEVYGELLPKLVAAGFWTVVKANQYHITLAFREPSEMCSGSVSPNVLGDRLLINPNKLNYRIPVIESELIAANWHKGSCFAGMGHHWFYDIESAPKMSWQAQNLLPIVPMFDNGNINAIFFASSSVQQGLFDAHTWEPIPLLNSLFCQNTCDKDCTFEGTSAWSTYHIYFRDRSAVTCNGGCEMACCP